MLKNIAYSFNPALYDARLAEVAVERKKWDLVYPVFFYNSSMHPGDLLSLHLFEPRYKVFRCIYLPFYLFRDYRL